MESNATLPIYWPEESGTVRTETRDVPIETARMEWRYSAGTNTAAGGLVWFARGGGAVRPECFSG